MADDSLSPPQDWQKVRRAHRATRFRPIITIRSNGTIAISADFVRMSGIAGRTRASLYLSRDGRKLGFDFHDDERDDDAFVLARDGGGGASPGLNRVVTASALLSQSPTFTALCKEGPKLRQCEPKKIDGKWVIGLIPCFESQDSDDVALSADATGIYRYRLGSETVYIGRGALRARFGQPERRQWQFDRIEYSVLQDDIAERRWETFWLGEYRERNGRWPIYNKIAASSVGRVAPHEQGGRSADGS